MQYDVMYKPLPMFYFSCGLIGHSSVTCPSPATRDSEGKLPYHGDKLCVPEKKKGSAMPMDQSQSSKSSWNGTEIGSGSQASASAAEEGKNAAKSAEVNSPIKKNPRPRRASMSRNKETAVTIAGAVRLATSPTKPGQKRKQKQVYRQKAVPGVNEGTLVPVPIGVAVVPGKGHDGLADQIEAASDDSNKKQRINSTRSADPAAAVEQPRHSQ
jgi:hypothetical protein